MGLNQTNQTVNYLSSKQYNTARHLEYKSYGAFMVLQPLNWTTMPNAALSSASFYLPSNPTESETIHWGVLNSTPDIRSMIPAWAIYWRVAKNGMKAWYASAVSPSGYRTIGETKINSNLIYATVKFVSTVQDQGYAEQAVKSIKFVTTK